MTAVITCPAWCESDHAKESTHPEDRPLHDKFFGDPGGAGISAWVMFYPNGRIKDSGFLFSIEESTDPEDLEEVAEWCTSAAAFMREIRAETGHA